MRRSALMFVGFLMLSPTVGGARSTDGVWRRLDTGTLKPPIRKHSTLIYDAASKRVVMMGGDKAGGGAYSDVWAFSLPCGPWVQLFADNATDCASTTRPCRRHGHVATYIPGSPAKMFLHGGKRENGVLIDDTWEMTLGATSAWTRLSASSTAQDRWHHAMVRLNGTPFYFGGGIFGGIGMCDSWAFGGTVWVHVSGNPTGSGPCPTSVPERRYHHSLTLDTVNNRALTAGGEYEDTVGFTSNVWWTTNGGSWVPLGDVPEGYSRIFHTADHDPVAQRMLVIGGYFMTAYSQEIKDTVLSMSTSMSNYGAWAPAPLSPSGTGPGVIAEHAAVYDPDADRVILFGGVTATGALRNDLWALEFADDTTPPAAVTNLQFTNLTPSSATIRWTAPGDDGTTGKACSYEVRYSLSEITDDASFAAATLHPYSPIPATPGTLQSTNIGGLTSGLVYYFAMKTSDEKGNLSGLSNVIAQCIPYTPNTICDDFKSQPPAEGGSGTRVQFGIRSLGSQPSTMPLRVDFGLVRSGPVTIEMFDVAGRRVVHRDLGDLATGEHAASLSGGSSLAAGLYVVRLRQGDTMSTRRVVLLQ